MAEKKEQLRIEGELDTSKLKSGAKQGFDAISKEEKKVQQESRQTSKALDDIGNAGKNAGRAMQQAGQQSTSALKNIGNEAKNTVTQIDNIAKATKQIKLQQALGAANRAISELAPVGQMLGKAAGMSDDDISLAGAGISGAMSGAMIGASIGGPLAPLTAAGGALVGAATSLVTASEKLKEAAAEQRKEAQGRYESVIQNMKDVKAQEDWGNRLKGFAAGLSDPETTKKNREKIQREIARYQTENSGLQMEIDAKGVETQQYVDYLDKTFHGEKAQKRIAEAFNQSSDFIGERFSTIQANKGKIAQLQSLLDAADRAEAASKAKPTPTPTTPEKAPKVELPDNREKISSFSKLLSDTEKLGSVRLSDSLTRVGGGTGYGTQMNGIASKVTTITDTLKSILSELKGIKQDESSETVFTN